MKKSVIIVGAGTLGLFALEIIERLSNYKCEGFLDDSFPQQKSKLGIPIIGSIKDIDKYKNSQFIIGIGDPKFRCDFHQNWSNKGIIFATIIDPSCIISKRATIENGVIIGPNSSVLQGSYVGFGSCILSHVNINQNLNIGPYCLIGAGSVLGNDASLGMGCHLGLATMVAKHQQINEWETIIN